MAIIKPECHLSGEKFSPSQLLLEIPNLIIRLADEPDDYNGFCCIETPKIIQNHLRIEWMLDYILEHKKKFINAGATEIIFWLYWHGLQGNMEFKPIEIKKLALLEITFCIDYIQQEYDEWED
jgi:hypothetical protein